MKSRVNVITYLLILAALLTIVESTFASNYYVSIDGSNETGDGSSIKPWRTIQYTVNQIYESDATVYVTAGTYEEQVVVQPIATGIDLIGAGADVTIIDASGRVKNGGAIKLPPGEGFTISGFTITGGTYEGSGSPGGAIRGVSATGFNVSTTSALVENNIIVDNRSWGMIMLAVLSHWVLIALSEITNS